VVPAHLLHSDVGHPTRHLPFSRWYIGFGRGPEFCIPPSQVSPPACPGPKLLFSGRLTRASLRCGYFRSVVAYFPLPASVNLQYDPCGGPCDAFPVGYRPFPNDATGCSLPPSFHACPVPSCAGDSVSSSSQFSCTGLMTRQNIRIVPSFFLFICQNMRTFSLFPYCIV